jgi:soluble lytic murein transglycosylase-like protein
MAALKRGARGLTVAAALLLSVSAGARAEVPDARDPTRAWYGLISEAARRFSIPEAWIRNVMAMESGGRAVRDGRATTSRAGAMGLMQIMPGTWQNLRERYRLGSDPYDPHDNILAGAAYLSELYRQYGYPDLLAAYNAGPSRLGAFLRGEKPLPAETQAYLAKIMVRGPPTGVSHVRQSLFFDVGHSDSRLTAVSSSLLFVPLHRD